MPKQKFFSSSYRIFTKVIAVFFVVLLIHSFPFFFTFKNSAQVVHYREYIRGENGIGTDQGKVAEGAQTSTEIEAIENAILTEVKTELQKKAQNYSEKEELRQAKEKLKEAEKKAKDSKKEYEEANEKHQKAKEESSSTEEQRDKTGKLWQISQDNEETRKKELQNVRIKVIENIQSELKRANLAITDLNIEFTNRKTWEKRPLHRSILLDPVRFFLIQPLQWISRQCGITNLSYGVFWDLLLKVLIMRLLLNWISYPPKLTELDLKSRESSEPTDLASLEEEREIAKQQLENMKQVLFNFAMTLLLVSVFSLHPFAFDRSNDLFSKNRDMFPWMLLYLVVFFFSQFVATLNYQKLTLGNYSRKGTTWLSIVLVFAISWYFYSQIGRFGDYLFALLSEVINLLINLVKITYRRNKPAKKEKVKWERKKVWSYHNYKD